MQERCPIACPARPPGRIPALAFLKNCRAVVSCISLFFLQTRQTRGARLHTRRRNKKPGAVSRPGGGVLSMNTLFWKILVTRVKRIMRGNLMWRNFLRF
jgi:hypothetical protein